MRYLVVKSATTARHKLVQGTEIDGTEFDAGEVEALLDRGIVEELDEPRGFSDEQYGMRYEPPPSAPPPPPLVAEEDNP